VYYSDREVGYASWWDLTRIVKALLVMDEGEVKETGWSVEEKEVARV
jgi:hypothetical protein